MAAAKRDETQAGRQGWADSAWPCVGLADLHHMAVRCAIDLRQMDAQAVISSPAGAYGTGSLSVVYALEWRCSRCERVDASRVWSGRELSVVIVMYLPQGGAGLSAPSALYSLSVDGCVVLSCVYVEM